MAKKKRRPVRQGERIEQDSAIDFEEALAEVESIVGKLESGELGLTDSLAQYEVGIKRLKQCHAMLQKAERRVTLLSGLDEDGNPITEDFDIEENSGSSRRASPSKKRLRSGGADSQDSVDDLPGLF